MVPMKTRAKKITTSKAFPLQEHPDHKSKLIVISDTLQKQIREEKQFITFQACPFKNMRTTLWSNVKHVDWAELPKK